MGSFRALFFRRSLAEGLPSRFKRCGNTFAREIGGVLQSFTLKCYRGGGMCTIEFGVSPLCAGIDSIDIGTYNLSHFEKYDDWTYDKTVESMEQCVDRIFHYINQYLLPFFERSESVEDAWHALIGLERLFCENRKQYLAKQHICDRAGHNAETSAFLDSTKYYMALRRKDYSTALICRKAVLRQNVDALKAVQSYPWFPEKEIAKREGKIAQIKKEIELLERGDTAYFERIIEENEIISINYLRQKGIC